MNKLNDLITKFESNIQDINNPKSPFTEMDTRVEYIDKFLIFYTLFITFLSSIYEIHY